MAEAFEGAVAGCHLVATPYGVVCPRVAGDPKKACLRSLSADALRQHCITCHDADNSDTVLDDAAHWTEVSRALRALCERKALAAERGDINGTPSAVTAHGCSLCPQYAATSREAATRHLKCAAHGSREARVRSPIKAYFVHGALVPSDGFFPVSNRGLMVSQIKR